MKRSTTGRRVHFARLAGVATVALLATLMAWPLTASALDFSVELDEELILVDEGERVLLGTFPVPAQAQGLSCQVTAFGNNNQSVHPGNNIEVTSVNTVVLVGVEDEEEKDTVASGTLVMDDTVSFTLIMGDDDVYSAAFDVTFQCDPYSTTTTSTSSTTSTSTTVPTTTTPTTVPTTTTPTTVPTTTTPTTVPSTTTPTTVPDPTTTLVLQTTTTAAVADSTTTTVVVSPSTSTPGTPPDTLPFTGLGSDQVAMAALLAVAVGSGLVIATRTSAEARQES